MFNHRKLIMMKDAMQKPEVSFWMAIIIPLLGIAVQYGIVTNSLSNIAVDHNELNSRFESYIDKNESDKKEQGITLLEMQVKLAEIQKDISFIRLELTRDKN